MAGIRLCGFMIELWEYQLGMKLFFSVQLRRKWLAVTAIVLYGVFVFSGQIQERHMYIIAYGLTVALIFFHGRHRLEKENRKNTVAAVCNFLYGKFL